MYFMRIYSQGEWPLMGARPIFLKCALVASMPSLIHSQLHAAISWATLSIEVRTLSTNTNIVIVAHYYP